MKKILFVLPSLTIGGLEKAQVALANLLSDRGHDVTVLILENRLDLKDELNPGVHLLYKPYHPHPLGSRIPYIRYKFYDDGMWETRASAKTLYKYYIGDEKFDVEIAFFRGLPIKIISGSTNEKSVKLAWVHSDFRICKGITSTFKNLDATKAAYGKFDHIICVSDCAKESFEDVIGHPDKTKRIYNLLPVEKIRTLSLEPCPAKKEGTLVVSTGHLVPEKGYDRLIGAVKRLHAEGFDLSLWLVGDGGEKDRLISLAGDEDYICFLGMQKNPYSYMKQADLYVCSSRYEGFNLTVVEALILGRAVLSTDCTGPTEILDHGTYGAICENSEEGLYEGIKLLLENVEQRKKYETTAQTRGDDFSKEKILGDLLSLIEE